MSKILALAVAVTLLGVSACKSVNGEAPKPSVAQTTPAKAAPQAAGEAVASPTAETPAVAAKPVEAATETTSAQPASEAKPAMAAPAAVHPATKSEAPATQAGKQGIFTKEQALALASKGNCLNCHRIESKLVGPAWKDVAAKYKADANGVSTITSHIKSGGSFGWKLCVMPPRGGSKISDADVSNLAKFIASLK